MDIRPLQPDIFEQWLRFRRQHYPVFPHYATRAFYRYRFEQCPASQRPVHRVAVHQGEIVGELYAVRVRVAVNDTEFDAWAPADLMVAENFRKLGLWRYLFAEVVKPLGCESFVALAAGKHTFDFYKVFGEYAPIMAGTWHHLPLDLRPYFIRQGKPAILGLLATPVVWKSLAKARCPTSPVTVRPMELPTDFTNQPFLGNQLANINDAEWYRWRIQPVDGFKDGDQFLEAIRDGHRVGFAICGCTQRFLRADLPATWIGLIKECRVLAGEDAALAALLHGCIVWLRKRRGLEGIRMFASGTLSERLVALGFSRREPHQAIIGGPLLATARQALSGMSSHDDVEVRLG